MAVQKSGIKLEPSIQVRVELGRGIFDESPSQCDICANDVEGESMVLSEEEGPGGNPESPQAFLGVRSCLSYWTVYPIRVPLHEQLVRFWSVR